MSTLHLIRQSAFSTNDLSQCISLCKKDDEMVLMDDGTYNINHKLIIELPAGFTINVISLHAAARSICIPETITGIEMSDVVKLTFKHDKVITWQ